MHTQAHAIYIYLFFDQNYIYFFRNIYYISKICKMYFKMN